MHRQMPRHQVHLQQQQDGVLSRLQVSSLEVGYRMQFVALYNTVSTCLPAQTCDPSKATLMQDQGAILSMMTAHACRPWFGLTEASPTLCSCLTTSLPASCSVCRGVGRTNLEASQHHRHTWGLLGTANVLSSFKCECPTVVAGFSVPLMSEI